MSFSWWTSRPSSSMAVLRYAIDDVGSLGIDPKVRRVTTGSVVTGMQDVQTFGNISIGQDPTGAMCAEGLVERETAIQAAIAIPG